MLVEKKQRSFKYPDESHIIGDKRLPRTDKYAYKPIK